MITISNLSSKKKGNNYSFADLHLDLTEKKVSNNNRNNNIVSGNDIVIDTDAEAIKSSIINILFQKRYLVPLFNVNIKRYIGQPISDMTNRTIGEAIQRGLTLFEPRIKLANIIVEANTDKYQYNIAIIYSLLNFTQAAQSLIGTLDNFGNFTLSK